jgi:hypothetical protein
MGKLLGIGQAVGGIVAAPVTGGTSLLAVPGGLSAAKGQGERTRSVQTGGDSPQVRSVRAPENEFSKATQLGSLIGLGQKAADKFGDSQAKVDEAQQGVDTRQDLPQVKDQEAFASFGRSLRARANPEQDFETLKTFARAEQELNQLRQDNPALAKELSPIFFDSAFELMKRFRTGQQIS